VVESAAEQVGAIAGPPQGRRTCAWPSRRAEPRSPPARIWSVS